MEMGAYLRRIHCNFIPMVDANTLRELQRAHLYSIPFENLDIRSGKRLALTEEALFDKIVVRRRGGICHEQNIRFAAVLRAIGFEVTLLGAEVCGSGERFSPPFDHMALQVTVAGRRFVADVGFGDSFIEPLDLDWRCEQPQDHARFEIRADGNHLVVMGRRHLEHSASMTASYRFLTTPREVSDFHARCVYHQTSPDSHFTGNDICSRATPSDDRIAQHARF